MIALRRDLIASALSPADLAALNSLLQPVLTGIEQRFPCLKCCWSTSSFEKILENYPFSFAVTIWIS
jgi:hypothetical protein